MAKLYFYYSTMNAGKTTVLLQSAHNYRERGMRPVLLTPALDDRAGRGVIRSRVGLEANADVFDRDEDLLDIVRTRAAEGDIACVLVDESQFLTRDQVYQLSEVVDGDHILCLPPSMVYCFRTVHMEEDDSSDSD